MDKLTLRGDKLQIAHDHFYMILTELSMSEQEEFLLLITKNYLIGLLELKDKKRHSRMLKKLKDKKYQAGLRKR